MPDTPRSRIETMVADLNEKRDNLASLKEFLSDITYTSYETKSPVRKVWPYLRLIVTGRKIKARGRNEEWVISDDLHALFATFIEERVRESEVMVQEAEAALTEIDPQSGDPSYKPDWYDTHCPTCDAPEPTHTPTCAVVHHQSGDRDA